jgi:two-component system LytT family response regulator
MRKIRTIIIEDEAPARDILKHYLKEIIEIEVIAECSDGFSGLKAISEMNPDLVFLDIQMPKLTGFEMLEIIENKPEIIFTTAFDQFAIKAFELNAVDYLLKPYPPDRLTEAVKKAAERIKKGEKSNLPEALLFRNTPGHASPLSRIVVRKGNAISLIPVEKVKYIEAQDDYVMVYHETGKALKQQTMKFFENKLPGDKFIRIHRAYIVRIDEIKGIEPYGKENHVAILHSGVRLPVSRSGYKNIKAGLSI